MNYDGGGSGSNHAWPGFANGQIFLMGWCFQGHHCHWSDNGIGNNPTLKPDLDDEYEKDDDVGSNPRVVSGYLSVHRRQLPGPPTLLPMSPLQIIPPFLHCFLGSLLTRNRSKLFVLEYLLLEKLVRMKNENIWCVCNTSYSVDEGKCYRWYSLSLWMSFATSPLFDMCNCTSGGNEKLLVPQSPFWLDLRSHSDSRPYSHGSALFSSDCIIYIN